MNTAAATLPVMGHLVLGYPTLADSLDTARAYARAGVRILELQIPFSHPTADGPVITLACQEAVEKQQVGVEDCLQALATLRGEFPEQEMMVMSYVNRIFAFGLARFAGRLKALGIGHLIVPDLPVDSAPAASLRREGIQLVPVLAANVQPQRLDHLLSLGFDFYYLMSDFKITGSTFSLHPRLQGVIGRIRAAAPRARVGIGFGISSPEQAQLVVREADVAIIGSALITARKKGILDSYLAALAESLV